MQPPLVEVGHVHHPITADVLVSVLDEHGGDGSDEADGGVDGIAGGEVEVHGDVVRGAAVEDGDGAAEEEGGGDGRAVVLDEGGDGGLQVHPCGGAEEVHGVAGDAGGVSVHSA